MYTSLDETNSLNYEGTEFPVSICPSRKKGKKEEKLHCFFYFLP